MSDSSFHVTKAKVMPTAIHKRHRLKRLEKEADSKKLRKTNLRSQSPGEDPCTEKNTLDSNRTIYERGFLTLFLDTHTQSSADKRIYPNEMPTTPPKSANQDKPL